TQGYDLYDPKNLRNALLTTTIMAKYFVTALLIALSATLIEAKYPMNYYTNKAEESIVAGDYNDALYYAKQEIIDYDGNPKGYQQAAISLYCLEQPGQQKSPSPWLRPTLC
ncbi:MAG: hypothetical protein ACI304_03080, partial [Lepagella sp.]